MVGKKGVWCPEKRIDLLAAGYELGETVGEVQSHPSLPGLLRRHAMQEEPSLWGWGTYRKTERTQTQLAVAAAQRTMAAADIGPQEIDALVLCSVSYAPGVGASLSIVNEVTRGLGLEGVPFWGLTLGRCATAMAGLSLAATLLAAGRCNKVLVLASDKVEDEDARLEPFGVFSDAASACILGTQEQGSSLACMHQVSAYSGGTDMSTSLTGASRLALNTAVPQLMQSVKQVFHDNLFLPVISMREQLAGFRVDQLNFNNSSRTGHAFGADPVINLVDTARTAGLKDGDAFALISGTPGLRHTLVWHYGKQMAFAASS
jgi:3-oxoacyl-[acyl-carrier-protein] synthase-3